MSSRLFESIGLGNLDIAYLFIAIFVILIAVIILLIIQMNKLKKLRTRYDSFMKGKNAASLEQDIIALFEDNKFMKADIAKNKKGIKELKKQTELCFQKIGLIKYDAFNQMGGKLSFCLVLLDNRNSGFLINSVHSSDGCYSYSKKITNGECEISLGDEEKEALKQAMEY